MSLASSASSAIGMNRAGRHTTFTSSTRPDLGAREIVMYNPRGEQDFSSHVFDLLRLSEEEIRRQRGYFASHDLPQANWKRFFFD